MGDGRTYENVDRVRCVTSVDAMTADFSPHPHEVLGRISNRIINEVKGINRVVYDISSEAARHDRVGVATAARAEAVRSSPSAHAVLAARRRDQAQPALRAREGAEHARGRADRSRQPVRHRSSSTRRRAPTASSRSSGARSTSPARAGSTRKGASAPRTGFDAISHLLLLAMNHTGYRT